MEKPGFPLGSTGRGGLQIDRDRWAKEKQQYRANVGDNFARVAAKAPRTLSIACTGGVAPFLRH